MHSLARELVRAGLLAGAVLGAVGCRSDILKETPVASSGAGTARLEIVEGFYCNGLASVATAPEHCAWPLAENRSLVAAAVVQVIARVGPDGHAESVKVVESPLGFDAAAVACAMRIAYRPSVDDNQNPVASDTCRVTFRLARYASDINPRDPAPFPCPPVQTPSTLMSQRPGTCDP